MEIITITENETSTSKRDIETELGPPMGEAGPELKPPNCRLSRKRTKTGCLTCRKRRIKCGEERPTCGNCAKSKRQCQGYSQRVIFKDPLNIYRGLRSVKGSKSSLKRVSTTRFSSISHHSQVQDAKLPSQTPLHNSSSKVDSLQGNAPLASPSLPVFPGRFIQEQHVYLGGQSPGSWASGKALDDGSQYGGRLTGVLAGDLGSSNHAEYRDSADQQVPDLPGPQYKFGGSQVHTSELRETPSPSVMPSSGSKSPGSVLESPPYEMTFKSNIPETTSQSQHGSENWPLSSVQSDTPHSRHVLYMETPPLSTLGEKRFLDPERPLSVKSESRPGEVQVRGNHQGLSGRHRSVVFGPGRIQHVGMGRQTMTLGDRKDDSNIQPETQKSRQNTVPHNESLDTVDKCVSAGDQGRDSETKIGEYERNHLKNNDLGIFVALQATQGQQAQSLRTYHSFIDCYAPDMLTTYQPSAGSSPLNDSVTARIFYHFINVIAPSISIYERSPANPSLLFQGRPVHNSQQHIWTYTMPTFALGDQALLHAMLAIGSLHIARVQDGPITASLKHYHIALRRIAKNVGLPTRRIQPATLAATMLLGWYEVMSSDHQKWCNHVLGAKQLLKEFDFAGMTRYLKSIKSQRRTWRGNLYHHDMALGIVSGPYPREAEYSQHIEWDDEVNETLVGVIMGRKLNCDERGKILDHSPDIREKVYTQRDLEVYETQRDLFWWYCKQDMYQSVLSASGLFMPYDSWSDCLPRAPIGRLDAIHGTFDHLILLLGRLANFTAKDLKRKRKVMQINGGRWRPLSRESDELNSKAQADHSQLWPSDSSAEGMVSQMLFFAGMIPDTEGKATLPRGFSSAYEEEPTNLDAEDRSIESQTVEAEEEWHEIRSTFGVLADSFGPDFQALGPECSQVIQTPFGPALQYRTYGIGCIWISYYMGLVLCHRAHPNMPPVAMIAAGVAAHETGYFANQIGRIAAGIAPNSSVMTQIHTGVGAGLIESTFGLFVAGVQYQDPAQRIWLAQKCQDITRLTGWQTAQTIGAACEASWIKAAEAGRGPPYVRITENKPGNSARPPYSRRIDHVLLGRKSDNIMLKVTRADRVHYALGLLGVEDDLKNLDFEGDDSV